MKLYSKHQIVFRSILSALLTAGALTAVFFIFIKPSLSSKNENPTEISSENTELVSQTDTNDTSSAEQETAPEAEQIPVEPQVQEPKSIPVLNDKYQYTQDELQNISVYEKCNEAVVNITTQTMGYDWFLEPVITSSGSGSGSIIDKRGYVVTNVHVIEKASRITISLADGSSYEGKVIGQDSESDIAVLKFEPADDVELKTIAFGNSDNLKIGQKVIAIGNPFALERTMTTGIISGLGRPIQESNNVIIRNMIQTDAAINPGNSGGPLLDTQGRMIGINTMIISNSGSSSGVGFAVPVSTARRVVNDLLNYGKVNRGIIKARMIQNSSQIASYARYGIKTGMIISEIIPDSQAEKSGLLGGTQQVQYGRSYKAKVFYIGGDIITAIDEIQVRTLADYYSALEDKRPGDSVSLTVYRNGKYLKIETKLEDENVSASEGKFI